MLGCRDQHTLPHQTCGITDTGDVPETSLDLKAVQVGALKNDSRTGRCRQDPHTRWNSMMQSHAMCSNGILDC